MPNEQIAAASGHITAQAPEMAVVRAQFAALGHQ
jgi:hypothetical protein